MKTTRNIQQGLPFSIEDVKRQTNDPKLLDAVSNRLSSFKYSCVYFQFEIKFALDKPNMCLLVK